MKVCRDGRIAQGNALRRQVFPSGSIYSILILAMTKRKPEKFSATKAVKANARERVGQPKAGAGDPKRAANGP